LSQNKALGVGTERATTEVGKTETGGKPGDEKHDGARRGLAGQGRIYAAMPRHRGSQTGADQEERVEGCLSTAGSAGGC
ncbi:MAG: hypothetical protein ACRC33_23405, partial [Gemmataceae bacterium]